MNRQNEGRQIQRRYRRAAQGMIVTLGLSLGLALVVVGSLSFTDPPAQAADPVLAAADSTNQKMTDLKQTTTRWIEVNIATQRLIAWEGSTAVYAVIISSGTDEHPTVPGSFAIQSKHRSARMQGADYDVPDVPFTMYYYGGYAIHGAYWHHRFGTPVSHGCVNVAVNHAEWLFDWASVGTPVVVHF
jgi:lipoprotein-anchoring transpeptidase ErfK/SrfK